MTATNTGKHPMEYSSTLKVLVVEDNETNLYMLVRRLESRGFEIVTAINGQQGIEMAQSAEPDIVLMDMSHLYPQILR